MKLLSLRLCEHDSNISYFDGDNLHYFKSERLNQIKHHAYNNLTEWQTVIKEIWGIDYHNIDEIAIVVDPWAHNLSVDFEDFFPAIEFSPIPKSFRINHHYAHSLSSWMLTKKSNVDIVIDGFGDLDQPWSIFKNNQIFKKGSVRINGSLGIAMARAAKTLGIKAEHEGDLAGKLMGLQSYGTIDQEFLKILQEFNFYNISKIFDQKIWYAHRKNIIMSNQDLLDWIKTVHFRVGEVLVNFFKEHCSKDDIITYSGGVAQNVIWNTELKKHFPNLVIPPHCADEGLSLGAIEWLRLKNNLPEFNLKNFPYIQSDESPDTPTEYTIKETAKLLAAGKVIGWYQGHGEVGPRALGNRSVLMDPRIANGKNIINRVKNRESYRPFGASILKEYAAQQFSVECSDEFMLYVANVNDSKLESITHIDNTCRLQVVSNRNLIFKKLLEEFYKLTGCPVILNTSLNAAGKPIAGSVADAQTFFTTSNLDAIIIGNTIQVKY
jgi:carbamoyltransferase